MYRDNHLSSGDIVHHRFSRILQDFLGCKQLSICGRWITLEKHLYQRQSWWATRSSFVARARWKLLIWLPFDDGIALVSGITRTLLRLPSEWHFSMDMVVDTSAHCFQISCKRNKVPFCNRHLSVFVFHAVYLFDVLLYLYNIVLSSSRPSETIGKLSCTMRCRLTSDDNVLRNAF